MQETAAKYIRGCVMCTTSKPSNRKLGLYTPLPVSSHPWESISMDFVGGLPMSKKGMITYMLLWTDSAKCVS